MVDNLDSDAVETLLQKVKEAPLSREQIDEVLSQFAEEAGIEGLALDENDSALLVVDGDVEIHLLYLEHLPGLIAASPLPDRPDNRGHLLRQLLKANMSWDLTQGGTFGMLPKDKDLMLCRLLPLTEEDSSQFEQMIAGFVEHALAWRHHVLDNLGEEGESEQSAPAAPPPGQQA